MEPQESTAQAQNTAIVSPAPKAPSPKTNVNYAGFGSRLAASLIDGVMIWIISFIISFPVQLVLGISKSSQAQDIGNAGYDTLAGLTSMGVSLILWVLTMLYYVYFIGSRGQTLGKMAMKIKVVKINTNDPPGYVGAFLRETVGKVLSSLVLLLGYLWMLWDQDKQTWHDKIADTVVVRV